MTRWLAIDIGASSGRHVLGEMVNGRLSLTEVYRFENGMDEQNGHLVWDLDHLYREVIAGIRRCAALKTIPQTVAIDTWGVDYVLLDESGAPILPCYAYRDSRTEGLPETVDGLIPREELYRRTGIATHSFNTIYQLYADKQAGRLTDAARFLMMPDYLSYRLTGRMASEYTNATTTGLVRAVEKTWDTELLDTLGLPRRLFLPVSLPATALGTFTEEVIAAVGFDATVIHAPSHDTASAVAACPLEGHTLFLSSGTWSLIGTECAAPITGSAAHQKGFTNEGGVEYRYRFLENIMGMWLFQGLRRSTHNAYTYDQMMHLAMESTYEKTFDPCDDRLVAPADMLTAVKEVLQEPDLSLSDVLQSVYRSLAYAYKTAAETVSMLTGRPTDTLLIVGGGSKDAYLNRLTAAITGKRVRIGPTEATALGNIAAGIMYTETTDLSSVRRLIRQSFTQQEVLI